MLASEQIMKFIMSTYRGRSPPLEFLIQAWANTAHHFSESVRLQEKTPAEIIGNLGAWEHRWGWTPSGSTGDSSSTGVAPQPDDRRLKNELSSMRGQVRRLNAQARANQSRTNRDEPARAVNRRRSGDQDEEEREAKRPWGRPQKAGNGKGKYGGGSRGGGGSGRGQKGGRR